MIEVTGVEGGVQLVVKARPGSKRNEIVGAHGGALKVTVAAAPERGKANEAIVLLLAEAFAVPRSAVAIVRGATAVHKTVRVLGITQQTARERIDAITGD